VWDNERRFNKENMVESGIVRPPTVEEKADYKQLGDFSIVDVFNVELAKKGQEFAKEHKPFDAQCAKIDFQDLLEAKQKESQRVYGYVREQDIKAIQKIDLDKYGDLDRFEIEGEDEEMEMIVTNGIKSQIKTGMTIKYRCKKRGHGCSVFLPTAIYEERYNKSKPATKEVK